MSERVRLLVSLDGNEQGEMDAVNAHKPQSQHKCLMLLKVWYQKAVAPRPLTETLNL